MKLAKVVLDIPTLSLDEPFTYIICDGSPNFDVSSKIPSEMYSKIRKNHDNTMAKIDRDKLNNENYSIEVGVCVIVPFGNMLKIGFVVEIFDDEKIDDSIEIEKLKSIVAPVSRSFFDENQSRFAKHISKKYISPLANCIHLFIPNQASPKLVHGKNGWYPKYSLSDKNASKDLTRGLSGIGDKVSCHSNEEADQKFILTAGQMIAMSAIEQSCAQSSMQTEESVVLLDGVTGSGKTEVYLRAIEKTLAEDKTAIVLVPEISLTPQTVKRFQDRFGEIVAVIHSKMTPATRYRQWLRMKTGQAKVVVGARSALFSPLKNIGIIVIDEEHDSSYKQDSSPRYSTHDCALWLSKLHQATLILGSATPSIEALYNCENNDNWHRVEMPERTNNAKLPKIELVDMGAEFSSGQKSLFSNRLKNAIREEVMAGHKVILLHNRRGFANYMFCRNCGYIPTCQSCSVSLTYHDRLKVDSFVGQEQVRGTMPMLACHHCGHLEKPPVKCPKCRSVYIAKLGAGTQSVEDQLIGICDGLDVRIVRMDADTTKQADGHQKCLDEFAKPGASILVGTQMIAKGLDFKDVTLVGVILADTTINLPDFRSNERTFQLISQVAGRAGRADLEGKVIVQTYCPDNIALQAAAMYSRSLFLKDELPKRKLFQLSPYFAMANILIWGEDEQAVKKSATQLKEHIIDYRRNVTGDNWLVGDALPCALGKIRGNYRYHVLIKSNRKLPLHEYLWDCMSTFKSERNIKCAVDIYPNNLL